MKHLRLDPSLLPRLTPATAWRAARKPIRFAEPPSRYGAFIVRVARRAILPR